MSRPPATPPFSTVMSNSYGFGGTNACLVFAEHERR
jgi:3-oxoacyl-(acyl-carrier-protein) synthase